MKSPPPFVNWQNKLLTEWGSKGEEASPRMVSTQRRSQLGIGRASPAGRSSHTGTTEGGHDNVAKRQESATNARNVIKGTIWGTI